MARHSRAFLRYLGLPIPDPRPRRATIDLELIRWSVRGELRRREDFAKPHRDDFTGGLPLPREYPKHPSQ